MSHAASGDHWISHGVAFFWDANIGSSRKVVVLKRTSFHPSWVFFCSKRVLLSLGVFQTCCMRSAAMLNSGFLGNKIIFFASVTCFSCTSNCFAQGWYPSLEIWILWDPGNRFPRRVEPKKRSVVFEVFPSIRIFALAGMILRYRAPV